MSPFEDLPQPFARADVVQAGLSARAVSRGVAAGPVVVVADRLYAVRSRWESHPAWVKHRLKAEAAARLTKDAIVSHSSAAAMMGLPHPTHPPDHVSMTVLDDVRTSRSDSWRRFHRGTTPYDHIRIEDGIPRLVPARVVIDCARELHPRDALAIADGALRSGLVTHDELWAMRCHQRRWPGITHADDVLWLADGRRENWLESASAWSARQWGLPTGIPQVNIWTPDGRFVGRCDCLWVSEGIVGEADGVEKYLVDGTSDEVVRCRLEAEATREKGFTELGLGVVRWTPRESVDGSVIHTRFRHEAGTRRAWSAVFRCSCCDLEPADCAVEQGLGRWRRKLEHELGRKIW